jgi:hypothetical protein
VFNLESSSVEALDWRPRHDEHYHEARRCAGTIASTYLAGTNTRRVRRALAALFGGTVGKDTVSRT